MRYTVTRYDGTPVQPGDELTVDSNLPVTLVDVASPPWGDDETGHWETGRIRVRYSWGAVEEIGDVRADVIVQEPAGGDR
ncbi:hypothetical protein KV557_10095 [Kitasatospora aureofaciens]|uniref:hypothetical protein n=1 Tax=Kitasatospora aureofaciens TaxID=1894 RepID=UPI001C471828|nr:hypothetical protein [Kitasatospora aureofaciens]MBV6697475.1 hypothetical protein [Kitasatospora aureofaciens]